MARLGWMSRCTSLILIVALTAPPGIAPQESQAGPVRIFAPYWSESNGFTSTLMVRNIHRQSPMTITPVLYSSDGRELRLNSLELAPNSVQELSLRELMETRGVQAASGGLALEVESPGPMAVTAHLIVKNVSRGLLFTSPLRGGYGKGDTRTLQATWWLREEGDRGTLVLSNTSNESIVVHPTIVSGGIRRELGAISLAAKDFREFDFRTILQQNGIQDSMGLVSLRHEGPVHALSPALLLFNEQTGFSLTAKFSATGPEDSGEQTVLRAPYVLINKPDAALGFMREMKFTPYLLMSNTRNTALNVSLKAWFEMPGEAAPRRVDLPVAPLAALETRVVDLSGFVEGGLIPAAVTWLSLELSYPGTTDDLAVRIFSVDRGGDDVFSTEVLHHASVRYDAIFWDIRDEEQTLLSLRNVTDEPLDVRVTLSYNNGQGRYKLPVVSIPAQATTLVNLKQVLANTPPDEDGNVLPPEARFGAAKIEPADGKSVPRLVALAAVFDPMTGMCGGFLIPCVGVIRTELIADPTVGIVGSSSFISAWAYWNDGSTTDETWQTSFDSSDPSIVAAYSSGGVDFVSVGSVTIDGFTPVPQGDDRDPYYCPIIVFVAFAGGESRPTISGPNEVWYFGGMTPNGYATEITLSATGSGVFSWQIVAGADKVRLLSSSGNQATFASTGTAFSQALRDVSIRVSVNGVNSDPFKVTTRTPHLESNPSPVIPAGCIGVGGAAHCSSPTAGYYTLIFFLIRDNLGQPMPSSVPANEEHLTPVVADYAGTNWNQSAPTGVNVPNSAFSDQIEGEIRTDRFPTPTAPATPLGATKVIHWPQQWWVGSTFPGTGRVVQQNVLQKFVDHAEHTQVVRFIP